MFTRYYQEELELLRELGREFSREHPALAPHLAEAGTDPDVERVLEGVAYLTGGIRERLDDDFPQLTQTLLEMLWPHYLRPVPSTSIVEFAHPAKPRVSSSERIVRGTTELESVPVDGTPCRFRTCYDVDFHPLRIAEARLESGGRGALRVRFEVVGNAKLGELRLDPLRLYLHSGDLSLSTTLYFWLLRHVEVAELEVVKGGKLHRAPLPARPPPVRPAGVREEEGLFPYPRHSFLGYRLLQEYFTLPQKFLFVEVFGLGALAELAPETSFDLVLRFRERPPDGLRVSADNVRLYCTPVVNLTARDADPIRLDHRKTSYLLRPSDPEPNHFEVYSVETVTGLAHGTGERREYLPFYSFRHGMSPGDPRAIYYQLRRAPAVGKPNSDVYLSFVTAEERGRLPETETISVELTCTNRRLPEGLKPGDIRQHTDVSPQFAEFRNLTPLTPSVMPPLGGGFHWRLISHLALNRVSLVSPDALRGILGLYNFQALHDRQAGRANQLRLAAISAIEARPSERIFRGTPMRGLHTRIELDEGGFAGEGELYLFATVLEEFLALYVSLNAFSQLTVRGKQKGEIYAWPPRVGKQTLL
jgi:type VI secretion system protein ImpG